MTGDLLRLAVSVVLAGVGGELFVRGAVGLGAWARVPAALIGTTIAAFATSTPELSVGVQAALDGRPELALGDALGSNVINIGLVLGLTLVTGALRVGRREVRRDLGLAIAAPVVTLLALVDGRLARVEAVVLLVVFACWLAAIARQAMDHRSSTPVDLDAAGRGWPTLASLAGGLLALVLAGRLIVTAAEGIGEALGLAPFVVGATMVAAATSTPELATTLISRWRGHDDVGVGTVLGSNVFNNLWIVGVVALLEPIDADATEVVLAVVAAVGALVLLWPRRDDTVPRWRGAVLVSLTALYMTATVALGP